MSVNQAPARGVGPIGQVLLPTDNEYDIPVLRLDLQARLLDVPFARWGRETRKSRMRGTWHFYTDDSRFNRLWERPQDLINSGCVAAVEPNFSVGTQTPRALAIYQTYRKRYLARLWQEYGIRILVDLNVAEGHAGTNTLGVPKGWASFCTRGSIHRLPQLEEEYGLACSTAGTREILFVVYGGGGSVRELAAKRGWTWVPEDAAVWGRHGAG